MQLVADGPVDRSGAPVLVVDDEPAIQRALDRMLRLHGFIPLAATSIRDAVTTAEATALTAVILDLGLKGAESGLDYLGWLRQQPRHAETPVLILTGQAHIAEDEEALIRRHRAYVFYKPTPFGELAEYLKRLTCATQYA